MNVKELSLKKNNIPVVAIIFGTTLDDMEGVDVTAFFAPVGRRLVKDGSVYKNQRPSFAFCEFELLVGSLVLRLASECNSCRIGIANEPTVDGVLYDDN
jgi:hypothetical protein